MATTSSVAAAPAPASGWSQPVRADPQPATDPEGGGKYSDGFSGLSCPSASFCAGIDFAGNALTFDGKRWSAPTSLNLGDDARGGAYPHAVSCANARFCVALDYQGDALTYNGSSWSSPAIVDRAARTAANSAELNLISCPTTSFCAAADSNGTVFTSNGSKWSAGRRVDPPGHHTGPKAISCPSAAFCVLVDASGNVVTYKHGVWSKPVHIDKRYGLTSVSCPTTSWCEALDSLGGVATYSHGKWAVVSKALNTRAYGDPTALSCAKPGFCGVVGYNFDHPSHYAAVQTGKKWLAPVQIDHRSESDQNIACPQTGLCMVATPDGNVRTYRQAPAG
ncbi:MAG: hypothetical protein J2O48_06010 [Solirubrobacterales bacterium]|nr:hypothetical protein [Solirubrobacterales bacterium]